MARDFHGESLGLKITMQLSFFNLLSSQPLSIATFYDESLALYYRDISWEPFVLITRETQRAVRRFIKFF